MRSAVIPFLFSSAPNSDAPNKLANPSASIVRFIVGSRFDPEPTPRTQIRCQRLFHFTECFDDRTRLVAFASGALFNGLGEDRFDSAQLLQFCLNQI